MGEMIRDPSSDPRPLLHVPVSRHHLLRSDVHLLPEHHDQNIEENEEPLLEQVAHQLAGGHKVADSLVRGSRNLRHDIRDGEQISFVGRSDKSQIRSVILGHLRDVVLMSQAQIIRSPFPIDGVVSSQIQ